MVAEARAAGPADTPRAALPRSPTTHRRDLGVVVGTDPYGTGI